MDKRAGICWMFFGMQLFVWSYLSGSAPQRCVRLEIPSKIWLLEGDEIRAKHDNSWIVSVIQWDEGMHANTESVVKHCQSNEPDGGNMLLDARVASSRGFKPQWSGTISSPDTTIVNSIVASPIPRSTSYEYIAIACQSNTELWRLECNSACISCQRVRHDGEAKITYTRSIIWRWPGIVSKDQRAEFFLLTDHEIQCWNVELRPRGDVSKLWSYENSQHRRCRN